MIVGMEVEIYFNPESVTIRGIVRYKHPEGVWLVCPTIDGGEQSVFIPWTAFRCAVLLNSKKKGEGNE